MSSLGQPDARESPLSAHFQHPNKTVVSAYFICHKAEQDILADPGYSSRSEAVRKPLEAQLVHIRLLGHLMDKGSGDTATSCIAKAVVSAEDASTLKGLGKFYLDHFIRTFRKAKGRTPKSSQHQSRPSFNTIRDIIKEELVSYPKNHTDAKESALVRDNFRCVLSGCIEESFVIRNDQLGHEPIDVKSGPRVCETQCCHIMSESTNSNIDEPNKHHYAANAWAILESFGYPTIHLKLAGNNVHSLENILTLEPYLHSLFDKLKLWLEETEVLHYYKVCSTMPSVVSRNDVPRFVMFQSTFPELALPSPDYLRLHAACCRVANMSGAAGYLDMLDDIDDNFDSGASSEKLAGDLMAKLYSIYSIQSSEGVVSPSQEEQVDSRQSYEPPSASYCAAFQPHASLVS